LAFEASLVSAIAISVRASNMLTTSDIRNQAGRLAEPSILTEPTEDMELERTRLGLSIAMRRDSPVGKTRWLTEGWRESSGEMWRPAVGARSRGGARDVN